MSSRMASMGARRRWRIEDLPAAVEKATSYYDVCENLGLLRKGGTATTLKRSIQLLGLSVAHFQKGNENALAAIRLTDEEVFTEDSPYFVMARRRYKARTPDVCEACGQGSIWNGEPLTFECDHKDGNIRNNRWKNLRKLCPNCHSQTKTYRNKKR